jgi:hypothetical protein
MPQLQNHQAQRGRARDLQQGSPPQAAAGMMKTTRGFVATPWALRAIGRRGALMRHAALQTQAIAAGATLDTRRLPSSAPAIGPLPRAIERHLGELGRPSIIVEN